MLVFLFVVGRHNGTLDGRAYFRCPPHHGLFVTVSDIAEIGGKSVRPIISSLLAQRCICSLNPSLSFSLHIFPFGEVSRAWIAVVLKPGL